MEYAHSPILVNNWKDFSNVLCLTTELDPTYPVIAHLFNSHSEPWQGRFLLHYVWFYNLGAAIKAADETDDISFWKLVTQQSLDNSVSRGGARRHFRADNALKAIDNMHRVSRIPWACICGMYAPHYDQMYKIIESRYSGTQIGAYYVWKLMDLFDICVGWPVLITMP